MTLLRKTLPLLACAATGLTATAQVHLNEVYFNDEGTDDLEYVELAGTPGLDLTGYMVLVVEGDGSTVRGELDKAWDLTGAFIPPSGYFVLGDALVTPPPDFGFGTTNTIENGSNTFYLVSTANPSAIIALLGTHVDSPPGSATTSIPTLATIVDLVAVIDADATDTLYDGAQVIGPTGGAFPTAPNVYRCGDYPGVWDTVHFLAIDPFLPLPQDPPPYPTPGALNEDLCAPPPAPGTAYCFGDGLPGPVTFACPCGNFGAPGNGCASSFNPSGANLTAHGTVALDDVALDGAGMNPGIGNCIFLKGDADNPVGELFGDGLRCATGTLIRLRTKPLTGGAASFPDSTDTITLSVRGGTPVGSGTIGYYTVYYRNAAAAFCPPATFNAANGYVITW